MRDLRAILTLCALARGGYGTGLRRAPTNAELQSIEANCLICNVEQDKDSYVCASDASGNLFHLDNVSTSFLDAFMAEVGKGASRICIPGGTYNSETSEVEVPDGAMPVAVEDNNIFNTKTLLASGIPTTTSTAPPPSKCSDTAELVPFQGQLIPCERIASKASRIQKACVAGAVAMTKCPATCNTCPSSDSNSKPNHIHDKSIFTSDQSQKKAAQTATHAPTSPPVSSVTIAPSSPSSTTCEDTNELVTFMSRRLPCAWIAAKAMRVEQICGAGGEALIKCPHTCDSCPSSSISELEATASPSQPTLSPTQEGTAAASGNKMFVTHSAFTVPPTVAPSPQAAVSATTKVFPALSTFTGPPTSSPSSPQSPFIDNKVFPSSSTFTVPPTLSPSSTAVPTLASSAVATNATKLVPQMLRSEPSCQDSTDLVFYMGRYVPCSWVALEQSRIDLACVEGSDALTSCPATCRSCGNSTVLEPGSSRDVGSTTTANIMSQTSATTTTVRMPTKKPASPVRTPPTAIPTRHHTHIGHGAHPGATTAVNATTYNSTLVTHTPNSTSHCQDGVKTFYYQNKERDCAFIAMAPSRIRYACQTGQPAYTICEVTCHRCNSSSVSSTHEATSRNTTTTGTSNRRLR